MSSFSSIVFVVDIQVCTLSQSQFPPLTAYQDSFHQAVSKLLEFTIAAFQENPDVNLDVFVHKAEALTDDFRFGTLVLQKMSEFFLKSSYMLSQKTSGIFNLVFKTNYPTCLPLLSIFLRHRGRTPLPKRANSSLNKYRLTTISLLSMIIQHMKLSRE